MSDLDLLATKYRAALEAQRDPRGMLARARDRFEAQLHDADGAAPSRWRWLPGGLAVAAAAALAVFAAWPEPPLGVTLRGHADAPTAFVQTAAGEDVLDFSDGSEVRVRASSQLRLLEVLPTGAQVALERGAAQVSVTHRPRARWLFAAGPYRVHVVGTRFELKWDPASGGLDVAMDDGIVEVDGPGLSRQRVTSRQRLQAFAEPASASLYLAPPEAQAAATPAPAEPLPAPRKVRADKVPAPVERPPASGASWRQLADQGNAVGALSAAERAGFGLLVNSLPPGDVLALGDVALEAREPARATEAWLKVRQRFPGTPDAIDAALRLGHLADEQDLDAAAAVHWFKLAFREAPNAATAPQALGDWLTVLVRAHRTEEARKVAADYLRRFRNGPHAAAAKAVMRSPGR